MGLVCDWIYCQACLRYGICWTDKGAGHLCSWRAWASNSNVCVTSMHVRHSIAAQALKENQRLKEEVAEEHQRKQVAVDYLLGVTETH